MTFLGLFSKKIFSIDFCAFGKGRRISFTSLSCTQLQHESVQTIIS